MTHSLSLSTYFLFRYQELNFMTIKKANVTPFLPFNNLTVNKKDRTFMSSLFEQLNKLKSFSLNSQVKLIMKIKNLRKTLKKFITPNGKLLGNNDIDFYERLAFEQEKSPELYINQKEFSKKINCSIRHLRRKLKLFEDCQLLARRNGVYFNGIRKIGNSLFITLLHPNQIFKHSNEAI